MLFDQDIPTYSTDIQHANYDIVILRHFKVFHRSPSKNEVQPE